MTRVARALTGVIVGLFLFAGGVFVAAWPGWILAGAAVAVAGLALAAVFLLVYDVDPPSEAGVP